MVQVPKAGKALDLDDVEMLISAIADRRENFPDEPGAVTIMVVLLNIGDRFAPVECLEKEWTGVKQDIPSGDGIPKCPNGHVLFQRPGLCLGWVEGT